ncbi:hypothetical protein C8A05DRAFT_16662 [Staphylotrichum tortipilum]|uniref:Uncharacterized protein n=1 Tax=Staphylotrichum tortipilum TaxID=2831512 RepID=A0AAN6MI52_9PEZI|nr:hypothetical protein C8A05DRAFT_16662 [Staphylotrichum longicolle]
MSWPGDFSSGSPDPGDGPPDRPTSLTDVATILPNRRLSINNGQAERAMKLLSVPFDTLPQLPFFAPLAGHTATWQKREIALLLVESSVAINRFVTPEEADTLAFYRSNACATVAWVSPVYITAASYLAYRRRATYRFPFYSPKPASFNPAIFPHRTMPFFTGQIAERTWHLLRFTAYAAVSKFVVAGVIGLVAQANYLMGMMSDPRLERLRQEVKERRDMAQQQQQQQEEELQQLQGQRQEGQPQEWQQQEPQKAQIQQQQPQRQPQPRPPQPNPNTYDDDDSFLFDDATPVAPAQRPAPQYPTPSRPRAAPPASDGVSAWERIRQRARAEEGAPWSPNQQQQQQQQQESGGGRYQQQTATTGQYTYSQSEQEKAYAKEQAQKEFDAMLERERQGKGDSGERR